MNYNYNNNYYEERRVADKIANGERLTKREAEIAHRLAENNYNYNRHNGCMGRRYKDF